MFEYGDIYGPEDQPMIGYNDIDPSNQLYNAMTATQFDQVNMVRDQRLMQNLDTQLNFDPILLTQLGFSNPEIELLNTVLMTFGKVTTNILVNNFGVGYDIAKRIMYAYNICLGKVSIENIDEISKHLRKMNLHIPRIGIQSFPISRIKDVPRKAVIAGIPEGPFSILNSQRYPIKERMYRVVDVTGERIWIQTNRKPVLAWKADRFIDGILEIKELVNDKKEVIIAIDKKHAKLCNRFIIMASTRSPEYHHGMVEILCIEGTKVYVYAQSLGQRDKAKYNMGTQRVYAYGFFPEEIIPNLWNVSSEIYKCLAGQYYVEHPANQDFRILIKEESKEVTEDISDIEE